MTPRKSSVLLAFLSTTLLAGAAAYADPPATTVQIDYRLDPMDSESAIVFTATLHLSPASTRGSQVGWQITAADFYQPETDRLWTTGALSVIGGSGGLWWVTHANTNSPLASEFTAIPHIEGTAECTVEQVADLIFSMQQGSTNLDPGLWPFGSQTGFSSHTFQVDGEPEPDENGDDEPMAVLLT